MRATQVTLVRPRKFGRDNSAKLVAASAGWPAFAGHDTLGLSRRHANRAVEADAFAVEIGVAQHLQRQRGVFRRVAETRRERHLRAERLLDLLGRGREQRGVEQARHDRVAADAFLRQVARDDEGERVHAALRRAVGGLADLPVLRRDRRGVDDRAALAARQRIEREHALRADRDAAVGAHQIDLDDEVERLAREAAQLARLLVARRGLDGIAGAGAVDEDALLAVGRARLLERGDDAVFLGDVGLAEHAADLRRDRLALRLVHVEERDLHAALCERARRRLAEARCAAGDDGGDGRIEFHDLLLRIPTGRTLKPARARRKACRYVSTIWVCVTTATSLPSSRVMRVCQTEVRLPIWIGSDSAVTTEPAFAEPMKFVLLSIVVVPAPGGRFR